MTLPNSDLALFASQLETAFIPLLITVLLAFLLPILWKGFKLLSNNLTASQRSLASFLARQVVAAAEQSGIFKDIQDAGALKKQWAIARLQDLLNTHNLGFIDVQQIDDLIESAVYSEVNQFRSRIDGEDPATDEPPNASDPGTTSVPPAVVADFPS